MAALSATDFHILLALSRQELYGYLLLQTLDEDSQGAVRPDIGSLYRTLDRLARAGWIVPAEKREAEIAPGKSRRYYRITSEGREALAREVRRLRHVLHLADAGFDAASEGGEEAGS